MACNGLFNSAWTASRPRDVALVYGVGFDVTVIDKEGAGSLQIQANKVHAGQM